MDAYLDIETAFDGGITIVGVYSAKLGLVQMVGAEVDDVRLMKSLDQVTRLFTYNGSRFDLPVIRRQLGLDIPAQSCTHRDLMYDCWRQNLYGGLKRVEAMLGIARQSQGIDGWMAMKLWDRYDRAGDESALDRLLEYNGDDVKNLELLQQALRVE